jgi:hypothetical protein
MLWASPGWIWPEDEVVKFADVDAKRADERPRRGCRALRRRNRRTDTFRLIITVGLVPGVTTE